MAAVIGSKDVGEDGTIELSQNGPRSFPIRTTKLCYYVLTDNLVEGEPEVQVATNLPLIGQTIYKGYVCSSKTVTQTCTIRRHPVYSVPCALYEVECTFNNQIESGQGGGYPIEPTDPLQKRPVIRWSAELIDRDFPFDLNWAPIGTQTGEPVSIDRQQVVPVLEITRMEEYPFNPTNYLTYANKVNSHTFYGASAGQAWMAPMEVDEEIINGKPYNRVTYRIKFDFLGFPNTGFTVTLVAGAPGATWATLASTDWSPWDSVVLHEGYLYRETAGVAPVQGGKQGDKRKFNLKADGTIAVAGSDLPRFVRYKTKERVNFNTLNLGPF